MLSITDKILKLKARDIVYLSDELSLKEASTARKIECMVYNLVEFCVPNQSILYRIIGLKSLNNEFCFLILNQSDSLSEIGLYHEINEFPQESNRKDILDKGIRWLFAPPKDENNFNPSDLEFTEDIIMGDVSYQKKFPTVFGEIREANIEFCSLTKYQSTDDIDNKDVLLLERGGLDKDKNPSADGGSLHLLHGHVIHNNDLEILLK